MKWLKNPKKPKKPIRFAVVIDIQSKETIVGHPHLTSKFTLYGTRPEEEQLFELHAICSLQLNSCFKHLYDKSRYSMEITRE